MATPTRRKRQDASCVLRVLRPERRDAERQREVVGVVEDQHGRTDSRRRRRSPRTSGRRRVRGDGAGPGAALPERLRAGRDLGRCVGTISGPVSAREFAAFLEKLAPAATSRCRRRDSTAPPPPGPPAPGPPGPAPPLPAPPGPAPPATIGESGGTTGGGGTATPAAPASPPLALSEVVGVAVHPNRFRVGPRATAVAGARKARGPVGTTFGFSLSEDGTVSLLIQRALPGRRSGNACVRKTGKNRKAKPCIRYKAAGPALTRPGVKGHNAVAFSGRIGTRRLLPGKYRVGISSTNPGRRRHPAARVVCRAFARQRQRPQAIARAASVAAHERYTVGPGDQDRPNHALPPTPATLPSFQTLAPNASSERLRARRAHYRKGRRLLQ
jgi:hypothetical protein